jgi:predicted amidohydrolase
VRALLAQLAPEPNDPAANVATVVRVLQDHPAADLAVFPELFISGYDPQAADALAVPAGDAVLAPIADAARAHRTSVLVGFAEQYGGQVANSVMCIAPDGSWAGCYRKTHLFGADEHECFQAGTELIVADLGGVDVGPLVCFDMEFPEPARALARAGASLLVTVAANMEPYGADHALAARARALDNRCPHIYVNRVGEQAGHNFVGGSLVAGSSGELVTRLGRDAQLRCVAFEPRSDVPGEVDYLLQGRPDLVVRSHAFAHSQGGL